MSCDMMHILHAFRFLDERCNTKTNIFNFWTLSTVVVVVPILLAAPFSYPPILLSSLALLPCSPAPPSCPPLSAYCSPLLPFSPTILSCSPAPSSCPCLLPLMPPSPDTLSCPSLAPSCPSLLFPFLSPPVLISRPPAPLSSPSPCPSTIFVFFAFFLFCPSLLFSSSPLSYLLSYHPALFSSPFLSLLPPHLPSSACCLCYPHLLPLSGMARVKIARSCPSRSPSSFRAVSGRRKSRLAVPNDQPNSLSNVLTATENPPPLCNRQHTGVVTVAYPRPDREERLPGWDGAERQTKRFQDSDSLRKCVSYTSMEISSRSNPSCWLPGRMHLRSLRCLSQTGARGELRSGIGNRHYTCKFSVAGGAYFSVPVSTSRSDSVTPGQVWAASGLRTGLRDCKWNLIHSLIRVCGKK